MLLVLHLRVAGLTGPSENEHKEDVLSSNLVFFYFYPGMRAGFLKIIFETVENDYSADIKANLHPRFQDWDGAQQWITELECPVQKQQKYFIQLIMRGPDNRQIDQEH